MFIASTMSLSGGNPQSQFLGFVVTEFEARLKSCPKRNALGMESRRQAAARENHRQIGVFERAPNLAALVFVTGLVLGITSLTAHAGELSGLAYTNSRVADVPWSIHVVQLDRSDRDYEIQSFHTQGGAVGLDTLSGELATLKPPLGPPVAAINGDYYQRDKAYAGAPRGLQIMNGELLSAPSGGGMFWMDASGEPQVDEVTSQFQVTWPDGTVKTFGLNGERPADGIELYTRAVGPSTLTQGGCELILDRSPGGSWLPLHVGRTCVARIREIRETGDTPLATNVMVLSLGPAYSGRRPSGLQVGAVLHLSTTTVPDLRGCRTAIGGGPVLIRKGKRVRLNLPDSESYQISSMSERHPRAAIGWNAKSFFLVVVDGRQKKLSVGMTLEELANLLVKLGCEEAMNFDGGGSATLWFDGEVRNSPCDRMEREIANCLVIVRKK